MSEQSNFTNHHRAKPTNKYSGEEMRNMSFSFSIAVLIVMQLTLANCGWKFRVLEDKMPFRQIYLSGINNGVGAEVYQRLKRSPGLNIVANKTEAEVSLSLKVKTDRVVVGFSGAGRPRELEIRTTAIVEINNSEDKPLQPIDELKIFRSVTFNDTDVLATQAHESFHTRDINKQLAVRIIQKLQRIRLKRQ